MTFGAFFFLPSAIAVTLLIAGGKKPQAPGVFYAAFLSCLNVIRCFSETDMSAFPSHDWNPVYERQKSGARVLKRRAYGGIAQGIKDRAMIFYKTILS
ncbi:hypothetical protein FZI51_10540 [Cronobacter sakazakii]|nr:hypothetical protein FZI46_11555 [Cronobacter sakazakii]KAB1484745.1 hypothetical protein FZI51_10540 [Cronobacter sakazakii]KAB1501176.1 hypothetical protein FZH95_05655 [Cronobacter sakazakii]PPY30386.1 hypothetical protein C3D68_06240 [Cronobacter sakazakii]PRO55669.1 hypothetical protein C5938_09125 [Cronobacter sakazakii]